VSVIDNAYGCWGTASESVSFNFARALSTPSSSSAPTSGVKKPCHLVGADTMRLPDFQVVSVRSIDVSAHRNPNEDRSDEHIGSPRLTQGPASVSSPSKFETRRTPSPRRDAPEVTSVEFFDYLIAIGGL